MTGPRLVAIALIALGLLAFVNALPNPFVWDETLLIIGNPLIKAWNPLPIVTTGFFPQPWERAQDAYQRYRPLTVLTYWVDHRLWRLAPVGYHLTSWCLHLLNGWLVFVLLQALTRRLGISAAISILFLIHPLQPEAVSYIPSRGTLLAATGVLLVLWAHLRWRARGTVSGRLLALELAAFGGALLSMETAIVAPVLVWLYERVYHRDQIPSPAVVRALRRQTLGFGAVLVGYCIARALWCPVGGIQWWAAWQPRLALFGQTMTQYLRWLVWPVDIRFPVGIDPRFPWGMGAVWLVVYGLGFWWAAAGPPRGPKAARFGVLWYLLALLPLSNLVYPVGPPIAVHQLYLPAIGLGLALGTVVADATRPLLQVRWGRALVVSALGLLGIGWFRQTLALNQHWGDPVALYRACIQAGPPFAATGYQMLAMYELAGGRPAEALDAIQPAIGLEPDRADLYVNLGLCFQQLGRRDEAETAYRTAIRLDPAYALAYNNLAAIALDRRAFADAAAWTRQAIQAYPAFAEAHGNLGEALWWLGRREEALEALARAVALQPDGAEFAASYGEKLLAAGRLPEAVAAYETAVRLRPAWSLAYNGLAKAHGLLRQWLPALDAHERAVRADPADAEARVAYGVTLARLQRWEDAIAQWEQALILDPARDDARRYRARAKTLSR